MSQADIASRPPGRIVFDAVRTSVPFYVPNEELQNQEQFLKIGRNEAWRCIGYVGNTPQWDYRHPHWFEADAVVKAA
ncbi:MAG: hypothetical protein JWO84_726 [Parcubacteria group bacterium]|nr:hypothetical protein [Parcubacteria group bacterium]